MTSINGSKDVINFYVLSQLKFIEFEDGNAKQDQEEGQKDQLYDVFYSVGFYFIRETGANISETFSKYLNNLLEVGTFQNSIAEWLLFWEKVGVIDVIF